MLFKFKKIVGCIEPWVKNRDTNRIVSLCIVTALIFILYNYLFGGSLTLRPKGYGNEVYVELSLGSG